MYEKSGNVKVFSCNEVYSITFGKVKSDLTVPVTMISSTPISLTLRFDMPKECSKYYVYCATEDHAVAPDSLQKLTVLYHQLTPAIKDMTYTYTLTKKAKYESDLEKNDGDISKFDRA